MCKRYSKNERKYLKYCLYCFKDLHDKEDFIHYLSQSSLLCGNCRRQLVPLFKTYRVKDMDVFAFYLYNRFLEGILFQYKEGRDSALKDVFFYEIKTIIEQKYKGYTLVLMPSSPQKTNERGFYAMEEMTRQIHLPKCMPFMKTANMKQSTMRYAQRNLIEEKMVLDPTVPLPQGKLLLIDDVMTSGSTMHRAYTLLKQHKIKICVLGFHELLLEQEAHGVESCDEKNLRK